KHNGLFVQDLSGRNIRAGRGEEHSFCESAMHKVCEESAAIPTGERRATKVNEINFNSFVYILRQTGEKRLLRRQLIERGVNKIDAQDTDGFLLKDTRNVAHVDVQHNI